MDSANVCRGITAPPSGQSVKSRMSGGRLYFHDNTSSLFSCGCFNFNLVDQVPSKKKKEKVQVLSHLMSSSCAVRRRQLIETFCQMSSSKASVMFSVLVAALQAAAELLRYPPGAKKLAHFVPEEGFGF